MHRCEPGYNLDKEEYFFQHDFGKPAIEYCTEDEKGRLWCGNSENRTRVNFCPFCGYKALQQVKRCSDTIGPGLEIGSKTLCRLCRLPIEYGGSFWKHIGQTPRHPAIPTPVGVS